jgi:histidine ammonia-lyase
VTVTLTGSSLTQDELLRVAREHECVRLADDVRARVEAGHGVVTRALERDETVYGLTTGVGVRKLARVDAAELAAFNRTLILDHRVAQGPPAAEPAVRAQAVLVANGFARGTAGVRFELVVRVVEALNERRLPVVRMLGSLGQSDLPANADLAHGLAEGFPLEGKEGLALLNHNAFSTALAALALADARALLETCDVLAALDLEAFAANLASLHPAIPRVRPFPGLRDTIERLRSLLAGSYLWDERAARSLQDPLTFRTVPQVHGAARDALAFAERQLEIELNASQENPLVVVDEDRIVSVGNFDALPLAAALDVARIALVPVLSSASERAVKLLQAPLTGLPDGLAAAPGLAAGSLSELGGPLQALAAEARLLAQPVSVETAGTSHHQGIEDRITLAPLGARRLADLVELGGRVAAIELLVAARAIDLRGRPQLGTGTGTAYRRVRELVPAAGRDGSPPEDLEPLRQLVASGALGRRSERLSPE